MSDHIEVTPSDLLAHAATIDGVADRMTTVHEAEAALRIDSDAYGQLCAVVPELLAGLQDQIADGTKVAADGLYDTANRLRAAAAGYQTTDERVAAAHHLIRGAL